MMVAIIALAAYPSTHASAASPERLVKTVFFPASETTRYIGGGNFDRAGSSAIDGDPGCNTWDDCWDVRNIRADGNPWHYLRSNYGGPGGTLTMTVSEAYQNGYTAKFGLSASFFSAEFGFNVTRTLTVTDSYSYRIPAGKCARIKAYMVYQDYKGDIWHHPAFDSWRYKDWVRTWKYDGIGFRVFHVAC